MIGLPFDMESVLERTLLAAGLIGAGVFAPIGESWPKSPESPVPTPYVIRDLWTAMRGSGAQHDVAGTKVGDLVERMIRGLPGDAILCL
jgi:hypothetical protein